jgi:D-3-phosphoglycerate dehydrogenase
VNQKKETPFVVAVTQRFFDQQSIAYLASRGCKVEIVELAQGKSDGDFSEDELVGHLRHVDGWIVGHAHVTDSLLGRLPRLKVVARRGVGYERIDIEAVRRHRKVATVAVGGNDACVADHTIGLMIAVAHKFRQSQAQMALGNWSIPVGTDLYRKTVGLIGLGRIGRGVVKRLKGFEAKLLTTGRCQDVAYLQEHGIERVPLDELLARSDFVTLHAPLNESTRMMIDERALALMKPSAILINAARGGLVNDEHLLSALRRGAIGGAGLDVFQSEANPGLQAISVALIEHPNVVATPHSGASTEGGLQRTNFIASRCVADVLSGQSAPDECVLVGNW